jgi:hypothetical protein
MVEIPAYYYQVIDASASREWLISEIVPNDDFSNRPEGFLVSPRHQPYVGRSQGHQKIYVSVYTLNSAYRSISGNQSLVNITRATARGGCSGRGASYWQ